MNTADLIFKNANVITLDDTIPVANSVAISGNRIISVGDFTEVKPFAGRHTKVVDCQRHTLVPGFIDAHCHIFGLIREKLSIDLSPASARSIEDIKSKIREWARKENSDKWFTGTNYDEFRLIEKRHPTRWDIDEICTQYPVVLFHRSYHACVLNSRALELVGIGNETPEPPDGQIDRDIHTGEPNGILFNMVTAVTNKMPPLSETELIKGVKLADLEYVSNGITSIHDATSTNDLKRWDLFQEQKNSGRLSNRIYMMMGIAAFDRFQKQKLVSGSGDEQLRLGAAKIMLNETTSGISPKSNELREYILKAHCAGYQLAIHTIEPDTLAEVVSALECVLRSSPISGIRHRIEHCSECPPEFVQRLKKLKVIIVTQPGFLYYSGDRYLATTPHERISWLYRIRSFSDSGIIVAGSSDSPVTFVSPLVGIYAAVTRCTQRGQMVGDYERISPLEALGMYTRNGAYASYEENIKGMISPGKLADLVLLSDNPLFASEERIKEIKVEMTIINGRIVWEA
jgi:predicted amidohydrolase YtcJ